MMYSCHGLMMARQMCACVAEGSRAHVLPHLLSFSVSAMLSTLLPAFSVSPSELWAAGKPRESRDATKLGARWLRGVRHNPVSPVHHSLTVFGDHSRTLAS